MELGPLGLSFLGARSLAELCELAAAALSRRFPDRGVHVQIWSRAAPGGAWEASQGPEMSVELARQPLVAASAEIGEIVVDARADAGRRFGAPEHAAIAELAEMLARAAARELEHETLEREHERLSGTLAALAAEQAAIERMLSGRAARMHAAIESLASRNGARLATRQP